jgi:hypothetical protein
MISNNAVQMVLCITNSKAEAKETNLKYNTPITPHQSEAPIVNNEPLNNFFFYYFFKFTPFRKIRSANY